jgi:hypothetical protein
MRWSRELAGCTVQCPCGRAFAMPFNNPAEEDVYDLGEPVAPAKPKHVARAPVGPQPVERVLAYQPHFEKPSKVAAIKEAMSDTTLSALTIPIAMIAIGIVARLAVVFLKPSAQGVPMALGIMVGAVALSALTMFIGVGIVAKFMGSDLGSLPVAAAKLLAIAIIGNAVFATVLVFIPIDGPQAPIIAVHIVLLVHWFLLSMLFELDLQESLFAVALVGILQAVMALAILPR